MRKKFFDIIENKNKPKTKREDKEDKMTSILESMNKNL